MHEISKHLFRDITQQRNRVVCLLFYKTSHLIKMLSLQIRDYRNCLSQKAGTVLAETSPTIHQVFLQMCMENVVKDILSISNKSWTYEVLLVSKHDWQALQGSFLLFQAYCHELKFTSCSRSRKLSPAFLRLCNLIFI